MKKNIVIAVFSLAVIVALFLAFRPKSDDVGKTEPDFPKPDVDSPEKTRLKASFDIVRVEEDGSMVAAGKGVAGAVVSLMDGESVVTDFTVNDDGEWVYIPSEPLAVGSHEIWLRDDSLNEREESEIVVVDVPERKNARDALAVIMSSDAEDVDVLQAPAPKIETDVDIRSVKYANGALVVKGTASGASGRVNVYADNLFLGYVHAGGDWSLRAPRKLTVGRKYMIRADKVDKKGKVVARVEVPFEPVGGMEKSARRRVRVIKGDCLWNIARHLYGSGFAYVTIYQANKKQIKNPDLIYPNQVFVVPAKSGK